MFRLTPFDVARAALMPVILVAVVPQRLMAQLTDSDRMQLTAEIQAAAEHVDASRFPDLDISKRQIVGRIEAVDQFFTKRTTPANREAWLKYLDLQPLGRAIESEESPAVMAREAIALRYRLIGTAPGLELRDLQSLRRSVEALIEAIRFRDKEKSVTMIANQLTALSQRISELDDAPSSEDIATITAIIGMLESSGQAESAVASLRNTFGQPNIAVLIGEPLIQQVVHQEVNQSRPVRDCILGTRIVGHATINGVVSADLLPAVGSARVQVSMVGQVVTHSTGYNGPVRLRTVGYGDVSVSRTVDLDESGINLQPALAGAELRTEILAIEHNLRLVRKIARKRAAQQKPLADRIALAKMRRQVSEQFTSTTDQARSFTPPEKLSQIRPLLRRLSLDEPASQWESTDDTLLVNATFRRADQLSTVVSRPPITVPYEAAIQVHESVINNAFSPVLAGRTMTEDQLDKLLADAGRPLPSEPPSNEDPQAEPEPPFEIDFARLQPIVFEARDQTIRIGVRGTRFAQGRRELKRAMEITATYHPAKTADGQAILRRDGEVRVDFPGNNRLTVSQAGLKPTIQKKFADVFPQTLLDRTIEISSTASIEPLRGRVFHPQLVDAMNGWLTITIR